MPKAQRMDPQISQIAQMKKEEEKTNVER